MEQVYDNNAGVIDYIDLNREQVNFEELSLDELRDRKNDAELQLESLGTAYRLTGLEHYLERFEKLNRYLFSLKRSLDRKTKSAKTGLQRSVMESSRIKALQNDVAQLRNQLAKEKSQHAQSQRLTQRDLNEYDELKNLVAERYGMDELGDLVQRAKVIAETILEHQGDAIC